MTRKEVEALIRVQGDDKIRLKVIMDDPMQAFNYSTIILADQIEKREQLIQRELARLNKLG